MAALIEGVFASKLHTFVVGEHKKEIIVHAKTIANQSYELDRLLNGEMLEAQSGRSNTFEDVSEETFIRFCQFAYTGDYATPLFVHKIKSESPETSTISSTMELSATAIDNTVFATEAGNETVEPALGEETAGVPFDGPIEEPIADGWVSGTNKPKKAKRGPSKSVILRQALNNLNYDIYTSRLATETLCQVRGNQMPDEDYTPVFLGHAQLYVFADKWHINALKALTLHKLHQTLIDFSVYKSRRADIIELARFAYSNDNTADRDDGVDDMRALITHYITCELESLLDAPEFLSFLQEGGQFSRDLVRMMMKRIK